MDRLFALDQQMLIQIAAQLINAVVLFGVLTWLLYKPVRKFMQKRADGIRSQLDRAQDEMDMADKLKALYEEKLSEIEQERTGILSLAKENADERRSQMLEDAKVEISAMKKRAESAIQAERERVSEEMRLHTIDIATAMAEKFVANAFDADAHNRLFDETMDELEGMVWQR